MRHYDYIESVLVMGFLACMIFVTGYTMYQINTTDIRGQVKAIVEYQNGTH
jgi:hypothetical protein